MFRDVADLIRLPLAISYKFASRRVKQVDLQEETK